MDNTTKKEIQESWDIMVTLDNTPNLKNTAIRCVNMAHDLQDAIGMFIDAIHAVGVWSTPQGTQYTYENVGLAIKQLFDEIHEERAIGH